MSSDNISVTAVMYMRSHNNAHDKPPRATRKHEYLNDIVFPWRVMPDSKRIWSRLEQLGFTGLATRLYVPVGREIDNCYMSCWYGSVELEVLIKADRFEVYLNPPDDASYKGELCSFYFNEQGNLQANTRCVDGKLVVDMSKLFFGAKDFFNK